jgi:hypothetical protein
VYAAKHARSEVIAFLDQDDVWDDDYLENHWRIWEAVQPHRPALSHGPGRYWYPDEPHRDYVQPMPSGTPKVFAPGQLLETYFDTFYADTPCPCCTLIRREVLLQVEHLAALAKRSACEDQYLWWFVAARWPVSTHTNAWVRYRQHSAQSMAQFTKSQEYFRVTELTFLQTARADIAKIIPNHPLLTSGRLDEKINKLASTRCPDDDAHEHAPDPSK